MEENIYSPDPLMIQENLEDWVITKVDDWRDFFESNYEDKFDEYYRLWRGIWDPADKERTTERSRIISPALQQAVESNVAELEEATFGRGKWFDITDDLNDSERQDIQYLRTKLMEDFANTKIRKSVAECLLNAAVFGTGIAEICLEEIKEMKPATQPLMGGELQAVGVNIQERVVVKMKPVMPQNFLIEPVATSVEDAMGVAVDEFVSRYYVEQMQEKGLYRDVYVGNAAPNTELEPDQDLTIYNDDKVRLTKYYGLVPRYLLEEAMTEEDEEAVDLEEKEEKSQYVEAIVVIANGGTLLKAEENPYMMQDRPIVAFPWDVVPGRFWGRGVCEKGYNSQKALDTELRARIDALALTIHPMLAIDATRLPRGAKPEVRPGKVILTNGDPREVLQPFNFGQVSQITFAQAQALQGMVQQATGAVDSAGIAGQVNGEATAAGISMSLGAVIKRHKRTLINFQESFLLPFVKKAAYRYMQFDPENYPVADYKFNATSTLGIIAREYEVTQLVQLLQTMSQDSPLYPVLVESIIDNMNLSNREELIATMKASQEPDPAAAQAAQEAQQAQIAFQQSQTQALQAQAMESQARAQKYTIEAQLAPEELQIDKIEAITRNLSAGDQDDREFERRLKVANVLLKEQSMEKRRQANDDDAARNAEANRPSEQQLLAALQQTGGVGGQGQGNGGMP
tara:strand:- start:2339 stop:4396 length:2058 start_codon:yes stop_codon:yes gene_type:complete